MGMGIGINSQRPDEGQVRGRQSSVACYVWFTSRGEVMPKMIKFCDADGEIHTISHVHVISSEQKNYCGIPTLEFYCSAEISAVRYEFLLLYYTERQEWKLVWRA